MHAGFVKSATLHLAAPSGLSPWRYIGVLPDLRKKYFFAALWAGRIEHRAENRHLPEFVIERDVYAGSSSCVDDGVCLFQRRDEWFFADDVDSATDCVQTNRCVAIGRCRDDQYIGFRFVEHRFPIVERGKAELLFSSVAASSIDVTCSHDFDVTHLGKRGHVHFMPGFTQADDRNTSLWHLFAWIPVETAKIPRSSLFSQT